MDNHWASVQVQLLSCECTYSPHVAFGLTTKALASHSGQPGTFSWESTLLWHPLSATLGLSWAWFLLSDHGSLQISDVSKVIWLQCLLAIAEWPCEFGGDLEIMQNGENKPALVPAFYWGESSYDSWLKVSWSVKPWIPEPTWSLFFFF